MTEVVWHPPPERVERANVTRLGRRLGRESFATSIASVDEPERFWPAVVEDSAWSSHACGSASTPPAALNGPRGSPAAG